MLHANHVTYVCSCMYVHYIVATIYDLTKNLGVDPISSIVETNIAENSATITCELPCFSPNVQCVLSQFISCTDVNETIDSYWFRGEL